MVLFAPKHLFFVPRQKKNNRFWRCAFSNKIRKVIFDPPSGLFEKEVNSQLSDWSILQQCTSIWLKHRQPWASSSKGVLLVVVKGKGWSLIATWTNNHKQSHRFRGPMSTGICYRIVKWCDFAVAMGRGYIYTKTDAKYKSELYSIRSLYHFMYDRFSICTWCIDYQ